MVGRPRLRLPAAIGAALAGVMAVGLICQLPGSAKAQGETDVFSRADAGTLFVLREGACEDSYAKELREAGVDVSIRQVDSLDRLARFVGLPKGSSPQHIVIMQGYVVANHVRPELVRQMLDQQAKIRGLIGKADCTQDVAHSEAHQAGARPF